MSWRLLEEQRTNVQRNLAIEEAIARSSGAKTNGKINTLRFWRSSSAVVLGRFQCVHKEVNLAFCEERDITIARRFTGGGTVYHDEGNLNFSICLDQSEPYVCKTLNELYWNFIGAMVYDLQQIGIPANFDSYRSCVRINSKKITGTAGWIKQGVSFIHGTLLIDSDLDTLRKCLDVPPNQPEYLRDNRRLRCLESKRDNVTTIRREIENAPSDGEIKTAIMKTMEKISGTRLKRGNLEKDEIELAESLYQSRYSQPEWNLGTLVPDQ
ncbi:MAG: lipoate--protein ligase family protein [Candidatus Thorarchaeota archaeon]